MGPPALPSRFPPLGPPGRGIGAAGSLAAERG
jgi:hypothetical protein